MPVDSPAAPGPARRDRTLPGGGQRSPGVREALRAARTVLADLPGMVQTTLHYLRHRPSITHEMVECSGPAPAPDGDRPFPGDPATVLRRSHGRGPLYRRTYVVEVEDARIGPEELVRHLLVDMNRVAPTEVSVFRPVPGAGRGPGAEMAVLMPGPWDAPVRVVERGETSFRLATLRGHMEAGEICFSARWDGPRLVFSIESWARSGDRLYDLLYSRFPLTREMQLHMWAHVCEEAARLAGGRVRDGVHVRTERWREESD